jgi:hypothetical protein
MKVKTSLATAVEAEGITRLKVIISDHPFDHCPSNCLQSDQYCSDFDSNSFSDMQMLYSKCMPLMYVYVVNTIETGTDNSLVNSHFNIEPVHLTEHCQFFSQDENRCAAIPVDKCIDTAFCTSECGQLECRDRANKPLFKICSVSYITEEQANALCSSHFNYTTENQF